MSLVFNPSDIKDMLFKIGYVWSGKYSRFYPKSVHPKSVSTQSNLSDENEIYFKADKSLLLSFNKKELRDLTQERIYATYKDYDSPDEYLLHVYHKDKYESEEIVPFFINQFSFVKAKFAEYNDGINLEIEKVENYDDLWQELLIEKHPIEYSNAKIEWNNYDINQLEEGNVLYAAEITKNTSQLENNTRRIIQLKDENKKLAELIRTNKALQTDIEKEI